MAGGICLRDSIHILLLQVINENSMDKLNTTLVKLYILIVSYFFLFI